MTCAEKIKKTYSTRWRNYHAINEAFKYKSTVYDSVIVGECIFIDGSTMTIRMYRNCYA